MKEVTRLNLKDKDLILKNKRNKKITLHYRRLWPKDIKAYLSLQDEITSKIENDELFVPTTKDEFFESFLVDYCYGLFNLFKLQKNIEDMEFIRSFNYLNCLVSPYDNNLSKLILNPVPWSCVFPIFLPEAYTPILMSIYKSPTSSA